MTLTNLSEMPPGGYAFRDVAVSLYIPPGSALALQGLRFVVEAVQMARANNPGAGLDPSYEACLADVKRYQCARFAHDAKLLAYFCGMEAGEVETVVVDASLPVPKRKRGCASCGRRR